MSENHGIIPFSSSTSGSSSIKLIQQQISGFISSLSSDEVQSLLKIFERYLTPPIEVLKACKMISYKCYESKIELNSKIGCGFGRSNDEALSISIKDFFEVILLDEAYLHLVQDCFRQMRGQGSLSNSLKTPHLAIPTRIPSLQQSTLIESGQLEADLKIKHEEQQNNQQSHEQQQDTVDLSNQSSMFDAPVNESTLYYELSKKIGNISMINGSNAVTSSINFNNNSHNDIDEILSKLIQQDDRRLAKNNHQVSSVSQPLSEYNQAAQTLIDTFPDNPLMLEEDKYPLTLFQIYQMKHQQQQLQQQQQQQSQQKEEINITQLVFKDSIEPSYYNQTTKLPNNQVQFSSYQFYSTLNEVPFKDTAALSTQDPSTIKQTTITSIQQQSLADQLLQIEKQPYKITSSSQNLINQVNSSTKTEKDDQVVCTPPNNKRKGSSTLKQNNKGNSVSSQLNDTAFLPTKKQSISQASNFGNSQSIQVQESSILKNKENSFTNQLKAISSNHSIQRTPCLLEKSSYSTLRQTANLSSLSSAQASHQSSQQALWFIGQTSSTASTCCSNKEELERERAKNESLEKRMKLLIEENKILKSLLLNSTPTQSTAATLTAINPLIKNMTSFHQKVSFPYYQSLYQQDSPSFFSRAVEPSTELITSSTSVRSKSVEQKNKAVGQPQLLFNQHPSLKSSSSIASLSSAVSIQRKEQKYQDGSESKNHFLPPQIINRQKLKRGSSLCNVDHLNNSNEISSGNQNSSNQPHQSSVKKPIPKLNLQVLPNYHGNFKQSLNNFLLSSYQEKHPIEKRI